MNPDVQKRETAQLGFWLYLMTDAMLFASLFATYMILRNATNGGASGSELFSLPFVLIETILLLTSSYTCGLASLALHHNKRREFSLYLGATILCGIAFLGMEIYEFAELIHGGNSPDKSAFLSGFFTLVGAHGLHILVGLIWATVLIWALYRHGRQNDLLRKFSLFAVYWHFLDIVWIFIFTIVYIIGAQS